jgi:hypothetical protein
LRFCGLDRSSSEALCWAICITWCLIKMAWFNIRFLKGLLHLAAYLKHKVPLSNGYAPMAEPFL